MEDRWRRTAAELDNYRNGKEQVGLWYFDPYARPGKQSGAWMGASCGAGSRGRSRAFIPRTGIR